MNLNLIGLKNSKHWKRDLSGWIILGNKTLTDREVRIIVVNGIKNGYTTLHEIPDNTANGWLSMHNETEKLKDCYGKEIHIGDILEDKFKRYYVAEMYCGNMNTRFVMYNKIDDKEKIELSSALTYTTQEMILYLEFAIVGNTNEYKNVIICE